jgi:hypothetical protein
MKLSSIFKGAAIVIGAMLFATFFVWMLLTKQDRVEEEEQQKRTDAVLEYVCDQRQGTMLYLPDGAQCWTNQITLP